MSEHRVGTITHFFNRLRVATVRLEQPLAVGDRLHVKGRGHEFWLKVKSMQVDHAPVREAKPGQEVGIRVPARARAGDEVLKDDAPRGSWLARLLGR